MCVFHLRRKLHKQLCDMLACGLTYNLSHATQHIIHRKITDLQVPKFYPVKWEL